jgi:hypothetical protein
MRLISSLAAPLIGAAALLAAVPASAFDVHPSDHALAPEGYGDNRRVVRHWVYRPHYRHVYHVASAGDPFAYRYAPRAYYPAYGSGYWVPAAEMRYRYRYSYAGPKYRYHPSWGEDHPVKAPVRDARPVK